MPRANGLASLGLLPCSATAGATLQLLTCLVHVHHSGGLQPRVPVSLHNLEQFLTLSHTLPLHDSRLNTGLLIAKIQANLARNKANKMVDKIQPYNTDLKKKLISTYKSRGEKRKKKKELISNWNYTENLISQTKTSFCFCFDHLHKKT